MEISETAWVVGAGSSAVVWRPFGFSISSEMHPTVWTQGTGPARTAQMSGRSTTSPLSNTAC